MREKVENRLGKEFLLLHEIQEINSDIMEEIKSKWIYLLKFVVLIATPDRSRNYFDYNLILILHLY